MQRKLTSFLAVFFLLTFLFQLVQASEPVPTLYGIQESDDSGFAYFKEITGGSENGIVAVELDQDVFQHSNYADLKVVDNEGVEQPIRLINQDLKPISSYVKIADASLSIEDFGGKSFGVENLFDGDKETSYEAILGEWDPLMEAYKSSLTLDLGEVKEIKVIDLALTEFANYWNQVEVQSSLDNENYAVANKLVNLGEVVDETLYFNGLKTRYIKMDFWYHEVLSIAEIGVYEKSNSKILFEYDSAKSYKLFYGNSNDTSEIETTDLIHSVSFLDLGEEQNDPNYNNDLDSDGILNLKDNCPLIANPDQMDGDKDGIGDVCDQTKFMNNQDGVDLDYDGIGHASDNCIFIKNVSQSDKNQNGIGDECDDNDLDTVINLLDNCIDIKNYDQLDTNNDGIGDLCEGDYDNDGVEQLLDNCKNIPNADQLDTDGDGIGNLCDNCPQMNNADQLDLDQSGIGDICEDSDEDGVINSEDNCKKIANPEQLDSDADSVGDLCDNCLEIKNASQWDDDSDGIGNDCDDDDGDGFIAKNDNCPDYANPDQKDTDGNGVGDLCEDTDGDLIIDPADNCVRNANPDQIDEDKDGIGDACDPQVLIKQSPYLFYGLLGLIGLAVLYYAMVLVKQLGEMKDEEKK